MDEERAEIRTADDPAGEGPPHEVDVQPTGRGDAHLGEAVAFEEQRHRCRVAVVEMLVVDGAGCVAERDRVESVDVGAGDRSDEHTSELPALMRTTYAVFCMKK